MRNEMRINAKDCLDSEPLQSLMQDVSSVGMHWIFRTQDKEDALKGSRSCHLSFSSQWNRQRSCGHGAYRRRYGRLKNPKTIQVELQKASAHFRQITVVRQFGRGGILCCSPDQTCVKELLNCSTFASHQGNSSFDYKAVAWQNKCRRDGPGYSGDRAARTLCCHWTKKSLNPALQDQLRLIHSDQEALEAYGTCEEGATP
ncbi:uncharacterized protein [Dermacentor albipictus]|uniref:uncharacterized protein isoform X1 n=1 Tax=Dermacentor albipictus TaxID=60249 RepID=UPI0038FC4C4C